MPEMLLAQEGVVSTPPSQAVMQTIQRRPIHIPAIFNKFFGYHFEFAPLASGTIAGRDLVTIEGGADFFIFASAIVADNWGAKIRLETTPTSESWLNIPLFLSHFGSGQRPTIFLPPIRLPRNAVVTLIADDRQLAAADNNIRLLLIGAKQYAEALYRPRTYLGMKRYIYQANLTADDGGPGTIAASAQGIQTIRLDGDSDFKVEKITLTSDTGITVQIQSDGDNWFNEEVRAELLGVSLPERPGPFSGEYPFILPAPRFVSAAGTITVFVTNREAVATRVQIAFHGIRLFPPGGTR